MKKIFCHKLKTVFQDYDNIIKEKITTNIVIGVETSNMGNFAVIEWNLDDFLKNHSKNDINYCIARGTIDFTEGNSVWIEHF